MAVLTETKKESPAYRDPIVRNAREGVPQGSWALVMIKTPLERVGQRLPQIYGRQEREGPKTLILVGGRRHYQERPRQL